MNKRFVKKCLVLIILAMSVGCRFETDCDPEDNNYSHSEYDCYYKEYSVEVCDRDGCHDEVRTKHVCEDVHVCYKEDEY